MTSWSARVARMGESAGFGTGAGTTSADPAVRPDARAVGFEPRLGPGTAVAKASRAGADAGASTAPADSAATLPDGRAVDFEPRLGPGTAVAKASGAGAGTAASSGNSSAGAGDLTECEVLGEAPAACDAPAVAPDAPALASDARPVAPDALAVVSTASAVTPAGAFAGADGCAPTSARALPSANACARPSGRGSPSAGTCAGGLDSRPPESAVTSCPVASTIHTSNPRRYNPISCNPGLARVRHPDRFSSWSMASSGPRTCSPAAVAA